MPNERGGASRQHKRVMNLGELSTINLWRLSKSAAKRLLPPTTVARIIFWRKFRYVPSLKNPKTFSEKVLHSKFYERDARMPGLVDKIEVKAFVASRIAPEWVIPTIYAGRNLPPLTERNWPLPYVLKPSHLSGPIIFVRRPDDADWPRIEACCEEWIAAPPHGAAWHEWAYSQIEPRLIVEQYIGGEFAPIDYKLYVFGGRVEFIQVHTDRETDHKEVFYDRNWRRQEFTRKLPPETRPIPQPESLNQMIEGAEILAADWPFVRVDLYEVNGKPKFGEMTFYPGSGLEKFNPPEWDRIFGKLWPPRSQALLP